MLKDAYAAAAAMEENWQMCAFWSAVDDYLCRPEDWASRANDSSVAWPEDRLYRDIPF